MFNNISKRLKLLPPKPKNPIKTRQNTKLEQIAQILGLMEERGKTKDWLLEELKKNKTSIKISPTENSFEILKSCSKIIVDSIFESLKQEDEFSVRDINALTKTLHWFFIDIVSSSDPDIPVKNQIRKINLLNAMIRKNKHIQTKRSRIHLYPANWGWNGNGLL